jgi:hypothetical protein
LNPSGSPEGQLGVAVGDLTPSGIVRVHGETWSAVAVNGTVRNGSPVQVLGVDGVRLSVWGEEAEPADTLGSLAPFTPLEPPVGSDTSAEGESLIDTSAEGESLRDTSAEGERRNP